MNSAIINVRTQRQCMRLRRILETGQGARVSGLDRSRTTGNGQAAAIGAGSVSTDGPWAYVMKMQREGCQRGVCRIVYGRGLSEAGSCAPTHLRKMMDQDAGTITRVSKACP